MEILARIKKKVNWAVELNNQGMIATGCTQGAKKQEFQLPIFRLRLKYSYYRHNSSSMTFAFSGDAAETIVNILRGAGSTTYNMSEGDGLGVLEQLAKRDSTHLTLYDDGWFEGVFTYKKTGKHVFLTPYTDEILESNLDIIITKEGK